MSDFISSPYIYAIIIMVAAILAAYGADKTNKQRNEISKNVKDNIDTANVILTKLNAASETINLGLSKTLEANTKLEQNKDKIIETLEKTIENKEATLKAQEEIIGNLTGGNSFCYFNPSVFPANSHEQNAHHKVTLGLILEGNYPIRNIDYNICKLRKYSDEGTEKKYLKKGFVPIIMNNENRPDNVRIAYSGEVINIPANIKDVSYEISINAGGKIIKQLIWIKYAGKMRWIYAIRVTTIEETLNEDGSYHSKEKVLKEEADSGFPLTTNGEIDFFDINGFSKDLKDRLTNPD